MRVMLDTNILISAIIFNSRQMQDIIDALSSKHTLVLSSYVIDELREVVASKFSAKIADLDGFLSELPFEFVFTPKALPPHNLFIIRDKDDEKVLYTAIISDVDILITGDNDFSAIELVRPIIMSPSDFCEKYIEPM